MSRILTSVNEPIVVLVVGVAAISFSLEVDRGNAFGLAVRIVMQRNFTQWSDSSAEKFLYITTISMRVYQEVNSHQHT